MPWNTATRRGNLHPCSISITPITLATLAISKHTPGGPLAGCSRKMEGSGGGRRPLGPKRLFLFPICLDSYLRNEANA